MADPRTTRTHAADSAPGVGDGPAGVGQGRVNSKPGGRGFVWLLVALSAVVLIAVFAARGGQRGPAIGAGQTQSEIAQSTVPGTADRAEPVQPR